MLDRHANTCRHRNRVTRQNLDSHNRQTEIMDRHADICRHRDEQHPDSCNRGQTDTDTGTESQDSIQTHITDRQRTEDIGSMKQNSNLDVLLLMTPRGSTFISLLNVLLVTQS